MTDTENTTIPHEKMLHDLGNRLYKARKAKRMSQEEVAAYLKLSLTQVKGLETGDWGLLPDGIYALGFLRQYASMLGVDVAADVNRLKINISLTQPVTIPDPAIAPNRRWAIFILFLLVVLFVYFNVQQNNDALPLSESVTTVASPPAKATPVKKEGLIPSSTSQAETILPITTEPYSNIQNIDALTKPVNSAAALMHHVLLSAVGGDVWLSLSMIDAKDKQEITLKETLLRDGQNISIDTEEDRLLLTAGNAIRLRITIDDSVHYKTGTLGTDGKVLRRFSLSLSAH